MEEVRREISAMRADVTDIKVTQATQGVILADVRVDLNDHIRRTGLLEAFQSRWSGAFMVLTAMATLTGLVAAVVKIVEFFR